MMAVTHRKDLDYIQQIAVDLHMLQLDTHTGMEVLHPYKKNAIVGDDWMTNYMSYESGRLLSLNYVPDLSDYRYNMVHSCGIFEFFNEG
jgi:hypothetical protein